MRRATAARARPARKTALALALALAGLGDVAVAADNDALMKELKRLADRVEKLEARNRELEKKVEDGKSSAEMQQRVKALEEANAKMDKALQSEQLSEKDPELATRLKAVEYTALDIQKQAKVIDSIEGFSAGASLTGVGQHATGVDAGGTLLNYRADITVTTPTIKTGDIDSKLFGHFRVGQGRGVAEKMTSFVGPNASAFQLGAVIAPETSAVLLAQAWYQADIPLPLGGLKPYSRETLTVNIGKMDPFAFFDQNNAANDETRQFLASMFVHNALLDNPLAANVGADGFGFSPGLRISYLNERAKPESYRLSLGVFGAGQSADFSAPFKSPFVIAQAETKQRFFTGQEGNYRVFWWRNGQAPTFVTIDDTPETRPHRGWGVSFDQRFHDAITLFGRFGAAQGDRLPFDRTVSLGTEIGGSYWGRGADAIGIALGANRASADFRAQSATLDANGDGVPDYGFAASGWEKMVELYYRFRVHQKFEISPDFQFIRNPAANPDARLIKVIGARLQLSY